MWAREERTPRARRKATQAAASLEKKRARKAGAAPTRAPAAIMRPMFAGKQRRTVKKLIRARRSEAWMGGREESWDVREER